MQLQLQPQREMQRRWSVWSFTSHPSQKTAKDGAPGNCNGNGKCKCKCGGRFGALRPTLRKKPRRMGHPGSLSRGEACGERLATVMIVVSCGRSLVGRSWR